jgi:hypothetical protein
MSMELGRMWKQEVAKYFEVLFHYLPRKTEENRCISQSRLSPEPRSESETSRLRSRSDNHSAVTDCGFMESEL